MQKFNKGDRVKRVRGGCHCGIEVGDIVTVVGHDILNHFKVKGNTGLHSTDNYELVTESANAPEPHVHKDLIIAWANGAVIEFLYQGSRIWETAHTPTWAKDMRYRIKPDIDIKALKDAVEDINGQLDTNKDAINKLQKANLELRTSRAVLVAQLKEAE